MDGLSGGHHGYSNEQLTMENHVESSDRGLIELLRQRGQLSVSDLTAAMKVTATAVRQRLSRLMRQDLVRREATHNEAAKSRGRPTHQYALTEKGRRQTGSNFADLTIA